MILVAAFVNGEGEGKGSGKEKDEDIIGMVYDIRTTQSGYSFSFEDACGGNIRCFARTLPVEYGVYAIRGSLSEDGNMFFISSMREIPQNELYRN